MFRRPLTDLHLVMQMVDSFSHELKPLSVPRLFSSLVGSDLFVQLQTLSCRWVGTVLSPGRPLFKWYRHQRCHSAADVVKVDDVLRTL